MATSLAASCNGQVAQRRVSSWSRRTMPTVGLPNTTTAFLEPLNAPLREVTLRQFPTGPGMRVLDVGCGTGAHLAAFADTGASCWGGRPLAGDARSGQGAPSGVGGPAAGRCDRSLIRRWLLRHRFHIAVPARTRVRDKIGGAWGDGPGHRAGRPDRRHRLPIGRSTLEGKGLEGVFDRYGTDRGHESLPGMAIVFGRRRPSRANSLLTLSLTRRKSLQEAIWHSGGIRHAPLIS